MKPERALMILIAWIKISYPNVSSKFLNRWDDDIFGPEWERIASDVELTRKAHNHRRKEKRMSKKMGRPVEVDGLRTKILDALKVSDMPMTPGMLAEALTAHPKAIQGQLHRMEASTEIKKVFRGLYVAA